MDVNIHKSCFISPRDGDMLSDVAGIRKEDGLEIEVYIGAAQGALVEINGTSAHWNGKCFATKVLLNQYRNVVTADINGKQDTAIIYWLPNAANKYSVSVDDNIWAFADLTKSADSYSSIFDNRYLNVYKQAHDQYGAKVRLNLFYEIDNPCGLELYGPFNLSMMTERYKEEFIANADWLHLAFHAKTELPNNPYSNAAVKQFREEYEMVIREIRRFAGDEVIERATTNHWGSGSKDIVRTERDLGIDALMGYLEIDDNGNPFVSYYLSAEQVICANEYGFWKDHETGMVFGKIDVVLNNHDNEAVKNILEKGKRMYPKKGFIEVMIHEQYFYPTYLIYLPDYQERVLSACKWCVEHGYTPAFASEVIQ